jgi:hypothetical protein
MTCWMRFIGTVKRYLKGYRISDQDAREILEDVERDVGHDANLIKAVIDLEREGLIKRLKRKKKKREVQLAYV